MTAEGGAPSVREQGAHRDHSALVGLFRRLLRSNFSARPGWSTGTASCRFYLESVDAILFQALLQVRYLHHLVARLGGRKRLLSSKGVVFTRWLGEVWVKKSIFEEHKKYSAMMNEDLLKRGRYNESKRRLYTISVTDKSWEMECVW